MCVPANCVDFVSFSVITHLLITQVGYVYLFIV